MKTSMDIGDFKPNWLYLGQFRHKIMSKNGIIYCYESDTVLINKNVEELILIGTFALVTQFKNKSLAALDSFSEDSYYLTVQWTIILPARC